MLNILLIIASIVMLAPLALYVLGRLKDPFHPLLFVGVVSYFLVPDRLIFIPESRDMLDTSSLVAYLVCAIISVLGVYVGWYWAGRHRRRLQTAPPVSPRYDTGKVVIAAILFMVIANISHLRYKDIAYDVSISGYARDLSRLWIAAAILTVQAILMSRGSNRFPLFFLLALCVYPPVERFLHYGQRGDTFRLAALVMLWYLMTARRPSKVVFLAGACGLGLLLSTLNFTRQLVDSGEAPNRFAALAQVVPQFVKGTFNRADPSDEEIFGAGIVETLRQEHSYGHGLGLTVGLIGRFLPRQLFPNKDDYTFFNDVYNSVSIRANTGLNIPSGSSPSGFANGFSELAWGCPIIWFIFGFAYRRLWIRSVEYPDFRMVGYFAAFTMAALYSITQDLLTGEVNMIYTILPLCLVYKFARVPESDTQLAPALASRTLP